MEPAEDREVRAHGPADRLDHFRGQSRPPGPVPAPAVGALIGVGRKELGEQVVVGGMDLHPVEAGFPGAARGLGEGVDDAEDLRLGHRPGPRPGQQRHVGSADPLLGQVLAHGPGAAMDDLQHRRHPFGLDRPGQPAQAGHLAILPDPQQARQDHGVGGDGDGLHHHHAHPAPGVLPVPLDLGLAGGEVLRQAGDHGGHHQPVAQLQAFHLERIGKSRHRIISRDSHELCFNITQCKLS